ncbi:Dual specificity protein phosphatase 1 [Durusdinium trenchii]|uniref:Dual specificity protein phosphatase 1 n=1 Tax=Durusdinium trenchii TaxID=1381693 RepID=A0ABP0NGT4_9DINO
MEEKLQMLRGLVAQPIENNCDSCPSQVGDGLFVGNKKHATDVRTLVSLGVTGALNCAPTGISSLNLDVYTENGISYGFTNVSQDNYGYPILHDRSGVRSEHLDTAKTFYDRIRQTGGNVFFFCVAGQNRSATLAIAVQILHGKHLEDVLRNCVGEPRSLARSTKRLSGAASFAEEVLKRAKRRRLKVECIDSDHVEVELLFSGVCTMAAVIPVEATIDTVRHVLLERVNSYLRYERLRMAGALNKQGRLLYFYGLGIALASNNNNHDEYKFEVTLLSQYQEDFSSYTLKQFLDDYTKAFAQAVGFAVEHWRIKDMQSKFSLIKVKVLLVSLLNGFRDLTLMGVQAFDFNHMNNVLISRDCRKARLIDIDGNSKGSIQFPSEYTRGSGEEACVCGLFKPALDVDLSLVLPVVVQQLICGKGRGTLFVTELISKVRRAKNDEEAKELIRHIVQDWTGANRTATCLAKEKTEKHLSKVVEWFYALLMKRAPWTTWTNDIYDAMRCIDHLPIS